MLKPINNLERKVLEMVRNGEHLHGAAREILIEMQIREMHEEKEGKAE